MKHVIERHAKKIAETAQNYQETRQLFNPDNTSTIHGVEGSSWRKMGGIAASLWIRGKAHVMGSNHINSPFISDVMTFLGFEDFNPENVPKFNARNLTITIEDPRKEGSLITASWEPTSRELLEDICTEHYVIQTTNNLLTSRKSYDFFFDNPFEIAFAIYQAAEKRLTVTVTARGMRATHKQSQVIARWCIESFNSIVRSLTGQTGFMDGKIVEGPNDRFIMDGAERMRSLVDYQVSSRLADAAQRATAIVMVFEFLDTQGALFCFKKSETSKGSAECLYSMGFPNNELPFNQLYRVDGNAMHRIVQDLREKERNPREAIGVSANYVNAFVVSNLKDLLACDQMLNAARKVFPVVTTPGVFTSANVTDDYIKKGRAGIVPETVYLFAEGMDDDGRDGCRWTVRMYDFATGEKVAQLKYDVEQAVYHCVDKPGLDLGMVEQLPSYMNHTGVKNGLFHALVKRGQPFYVHSRSFPSALGVVISRPHQASRRSESYEQLVTEIKRMNEIFRSTDSFLVTPQPGNKEMPYTVSLYDN